MVSRALARNASTIMSAVQQVHLVVSVCKFYHADRMLYHTRFTYTYTAVSKHLILFWLVSRESLPDPMD